MNMRRHPALTTVQAQALPSPDRALQQIARRYPQIKIGNMVRRGLSFLLAGVLLLAGLALAVFEIGRPEGLRPFLLVGAGLMIGAAGSWLADEFFAYRRSR